MAYQEWSAYSSRAASSVEHQWPEEVRVTADGDEFEFFPDLVDEIVAIIAAVNLIVKIRYKFRLEWGNDGFKKE
jgi:hypothetical protein